MRFLIFAGVGLLVALSAAACGRSDLRVLPAETEEGGGGQGGDTTSSTSTTGSQGPCGNGVVEAPEQCDDGNGSPQDACLPDCTLAFCGDGFVHIGFEQCDDANQATSDQCALCAVAFCGDGFLHAGVEQCDDGNAQNGDGCSSTCKLEDPSCGNGVTEVGEDCDDANTSNQDFCLSTCQKAFCGDGFVWLGVEECDDQNGINTDGCLSTCKAAKCGDGFLHAGVEQCDDGNLVEGDGCSSTCELTSCGDGVVDPGEECDDNNASNTDGCLVTCKKASCGDGFTFINVEECDDGNLVTTDACVPGCKVATCGDGFLHIGVEQCDDGNKLNGDGCNSACLLPKCGDGFLDPGEICDDANLVSGDGCDANCTPTACGNGIVTAGEECDDGNTSNTDACVAGCQSAECGDGFLHAGVEQCDDGNLVNGDGCSATCLPPFCGDGIVDPGEACDLGAANADRPAFLLSFQATSTAVEPIVSPADAAIFYNYFSASGHTGFEALGTSILFLYANASTEALSLFIEHGIDFTTTGQNQGSANVTMDITGLPAASVVALSDDTPGELFKSSATSVHGQWAFQQNTDGGVVSGLPFPGSWTLTIQKSFSGAITSWKFVDGGPAPATVTLGGNTATLQAFATPSPCRTTCTVPTCGDGILDGGEVCDDGNTAPGDGCASDCKGF